MFRYRSARRSSTTFRTYYGPTIKAFEALDDDGRAGLAADLQAIAEEQNTADGWLRLPSTYVEVVAERAG